MKKLLILIVLELLGFVLMSSAQITISPFLSECGKQKCSGSYTLTNSGLSPIFFTIDVNQIAFSKETQGPIHVVLNAGSEVKAELSETSGRLSPRESRQINFKIECPKTDAACQVQFLNVVSAGKMKKAQSQKGVDVKLVLAYTAYLCPQGGKDCRAKTLAQAGVIPPENRPDAKN